MLLPHVVQSTATMTSLYGIQVEALQSELRDKENTHQELIQQYKQEFRSLKNTLEKQRV